MKNKLFYVVIAVILILLSLVFYHNQDSTKSKIVYVDMDLLYENFQLAKKYNQQVTSFHNSSQVVLDSIELEIKTLIQYNSDIRLINAKKDQYFQKRDEFEQKYQTQTSQYSEKVMKLLSQYLTEYGKENSYTYILSKQLKGQVLYADSKNDITTEVIAFANSRYKGE